MAGKSKTTGKAKSWPWALIVLILTIFLVVVVTLFVYYRYQAFSCNSDGNVRCWTDYECKNSIQCIGQTGATNCWAGVTAIYAPYANTCRYQPGGSLPVGCSCNWVGTQASAACGTTAG